MPSTSSIPPWKAELLQKRAEKMKAGPVSLLSCCCTAIKYDQFFFKEISSAQNKLVGIQNEKKKKYIYIFLP